MQEKHDIYSWFLHQLRGMVKNYVDKNGRRWTQTEIAEHLGITKANLSNIINGKQGNSKSYQKIIDFLYDREEK